MMRKIPTSANWHHRVQQQQQAFHCHAMGLHHQWPYPSRNWPFWDGACCKPAGQFSSWHSCFRHAIGYDKWGAGFGLVPYHVSPNLLFQPHVLTTASSSSRQQTIGHLASKPQVVVQPITGKVAGEPPPMGWRRSLQGFHNDLDLIHCLSDRRQSCKRVHHTPRAAWTKWLSASCWSTP